MPLAGYGHFRLRTGFKSTTHEYLSFSCLLRTANVLVGSSSLGHRRIRGLQILETSPWETFPWLNSALILSK